MIRADHIQIVMVLGALLSFVFFLQYYGDTEMFYSPKLVKMYKDSYNYSFPKCERNMAAARISGFDGFPNILKDFLYYRHCRHFPVILDLPDKCGGIEEPEDIFLLLVIKSSPVHYERREVLRKTWAQERSYKGLRIRRIFIIGTTGTDFEKERVNKLLKAEQQEHNDILQWDFQDTFYNLTLKQVLFLKWMKRNCKQVNFLLNGDDDVFANTDNIVDYLHGRHNNNGSQHLFTGFLIKNGFPVRWDRSKYFVPSQVYEPNIYPNYCGGGGFLLSSYTALMIHSYSDIIPLFPIDDVYMGMCLEKAKMAPVSHIGIKTFGWYIPSKKIDQYDPCYFRDYLLVHQFLPNNMYLMWNQINDPNLKCGITNSSRTIQT